jgi:hypothetical protein
MALVQRPAKQGGATTYQGKVALGYTKILASEADADHDTIYAAWNGGVDTVNIRDNAVTSAKLAAGAVTSRELADAAVTQSKLTVDAVTRLAIANWAVGTDEIEDRAVTGAKIAANAISGFELADGSVTAPKLATNAVTQPAIADSAVGTAEIADRAVTQVKVALQGLTWQELAPGTAVPDVRGGTVPASASVGTSATTILTFPGITTRGGSVLGLAVIGGQIIGRPSALGTVTIQWVRDGSVSVLLYQVNIASGATAQAPTMPFPMSGFVDVPPVGNHTYEMRVWTNAADMAVQTQAAPNQGTGFLLVFA